MLATRSLASGAKEGTRVLGVRDTYKRVDRGVKQRGRLSQKWREEFVAEDLQRHCPDSKIPFTQRNLKIRLA